MLVEHEYGLLSYDSILTSGTLRLFQSYAITPIAPKLPLFEREVAECNAGFLYENSMEDFSEVIKQIKTMSIERRKKLSVDNYHKADSVKWHGSLAEYLMHLS